MHRIACLTLVAALAFLAPADFARGQGYSPKFPPPIPPAPDRPNPLAATLADIHQTIAVRKLLMDDEMLKPLNLGVLVEKRIATLWGPVPSEEHAKRAVQRIRSMIEIAKVRNETIVMTDDPQRAPDFGNPRIIDPAGVPNKTPPKDRILGAASNPPAGGAAPVLSGIEPSEPGLRPAPAFPAIVSPLR